MSDIDRRRRVRFWLTAAGLVVAGVAGYTGFVTVAEGPIGLGIFVLASATGFAAFFSPCSFPLLLTFLTRRREESGKRALLSALRMAAGATALLTLLAIGVAVGGSTAGAVLGFDRPAGRIFRTAVGLLLMMLGLRQAGRLAVLDVAFNRIASWASRRFDPTRRPSPAGRDLTYGFGYLLAGFG